MLVRWQDWVGTETGVIVSTVLLLPLTVPAVWLLAWRRRTRGVASPWRRSLAEVGLVYGTVPWVWLTLMPGENPGVAPSRVILVPFQDLLTVDLGQVVGNLLVFAALGFFAPLRFPALASAWRVGVFAAGCSALIETLQYVLQLDRVSSVDDVLLNAAGAWLAALASYRWWIRRTEAPAEQVPVSTTAGR
ncbi:VanZ family protein [Actinosynnema sp. NPDC020468]|uniref:VanZ family protein n=1 Tax=Actinosynnema sp. NPDC020468 TaxID=3154488 RepID=UPI0033CF1527